jgi:hypothetical protein
MGSSTLETEIVDRIRRTMQRFDPGLTSHRQHFLNCQDVVAYIAELEERYEIEISRGWLHSKTPRDLARDVAMMAGERH